MAYYRTQKPAKSEQPPKSPITTYWPHTCSFRETERDCEQVVIIDPGVRNFCIRCEVRFKTGYMEPKLYAKWDVAVADLSGEDVFVTTAELSRRLKEHKDLLEKTDRVLIERQLPINYQSTLIMQHCLTFFEILLADKPNLPTIHLVDPQLKSRILAGRRKMTKPELKAWSPGEATVWLMKQNDQWSINLLEKAKKKDDFADVVVMREAYYRFIKSPFITPDEGVKPKRITFTVMKE